MAGRPTKYEKKFNRQAEQLARLGATEQEMADFFGIDKATLTRWKSRYPEFCTSLKRGRLPADAKVSEALFRRAQGFTYRETVFEKIGTKEEVIEGETVIQDLYRKRVTTKIMPADTTAAIFWLKNRRGRVNPTEGQPWRDRQEVGFEFEHMSDEALDKVIATLTQKVYNQE